MYAIYLLINNNIQKNKINKIDKITNKNIALIVPCYNETKEELNITFDSIYKQQDFDNNKFLFIICDGTNNTSKQVFDIFSNSISNITYIIDAYKTWDNIFENISICSGRKNNINFMIFIKDKNKGKRDSLTMIRRLLYYYNRRCDEDINIHNNILKYFDKKLLDLFISQLNNSFIEVNNRENLLHLIKDTSDNASINSGSSDIDTCIIELEKIKEITNTDNINSNIFHYIYGTDADTELDKKCIYNLIEYLSNSDSETVAVVGFVDIYMKDTILNPLKLYQYSEYYVAQLLRRNCQSILTKKVNCLSGCNQLLKICEETCGDEILDLFNKKPNIDDNIYKQILASASEDRNHVTYMFKIFPYVKTVQCISAKVYTKVPLTIKHFISQRKRWILGTIVNDLLLLVNKNHSKIERIQSFINIFINALSLYIFISTILFLISIINGGNMIMLYLSIIMMIPIIYNLLTPFIKYRNSVHRIIYYYISYICYLFMGPIVNICLHFYTLFNIDNFSWNMNIT